VTKNRIAFLVWLLCAACLHIFGNDIGTRVVLVGSIFVPAVMIILAWVMSRRVSFGIDVPKKVAAGEEVRIRISARAGRTRLLPGYAKCRLQWVNLLTGEIGGAEIILYTGHRGAREIIVPTENHNMTASTEGRTVDAASPSTDNQEAENISSYQEIQEVLFGHNHCGLFTFTLTELAVVDAFGLFSWKTAREPQARTIALPEIEAMPIEINPGGNDSSEAQEYSMHRPGNDISETFAIREYAPGDSIRSIHWKLSQKTDRLLVRELGLPVANNILILMETGQRATPERINVMAGNVFSISHALVLLEMPHTIGWIDTKTGGYVSREISCHVTAEAAFYALFTNTVRDIGVLGAEVLGRAVDEYSQVFIEGGAEA